MGALSRSIKLCICCPIMCAMQSAYIKNIKLWMEFRSRLFPFSRFFKLQKHYHALDKGRCRTQLCRCFSL